MKNCIELIGFILLSLFALNLSAQTINTDLRDGQIYLKYKDATPIFWERNIQHLAPDIFPELQDRINEYEIYEIENVFWFAKNQKLARTLVVKFNKYDSIDNLIESLSKERDIDYVEKIPLDRKTITPDDSYYSNQWHLEHINAPQAWNLTTGSNSIDVAVVDDAIETNHPDLIGNIQVQYDVAENDWDASPGNNEQDHGTHVAGIVAAKTDNGIGVASIGWNIDIICIKATEDAEELYITHAYPGVTWAAQNGAEMNYPGASPEVSPPAKPD